MLLAQGISGNKIELKALYLGTGWFTAGTLVVVYTRLHGFRRRRSQVTLLLAVEYVAHWPLYHSLSTALTYSTGRLPCAEHCCISYTLPDVCKDRLLVAWSATAVDCRHWYTTIVVPWIVFFSSRVSSFKSLLSAAICTNSPGNIFDGMIVPYSSVFARTSMGRLVSTACSLS